MADRGVVQLVAECRNTRYMFLIDDSREAKPGGKPYSNGEDRSR